MNRVRIVTKLAFNSLRYQLLKCQGRPGRLETISLEITHRCICRCSMCNIWQTPQDVKDLPLQVWLELLSSTELSGLREIDITGGEPFLSNDLQPLICSIGRLKPGHFPGLRTLAITSNGILTERILDVIRKVIGVMESHGIELVLALGLDAVGKTHDNIRNFAGAWDKLRVTIERLQVLRETHPNLILGLKTTIVPENLHELKEIVDFAAQHRLFAIISPLIITDNRFGNTALAENLKFSADDLQTMLNFYTGLDSAWSGHRQTMMHYLKTGRVSKPCSAGFNTLFVRQNGDVFPCPIIPTRLGNIQHSTMAELLNDAQAIRFRKKTGSFPECRTCTEPGLERIALPYEGSACLQRLAHMGFREFSSMVDAMGLDKYF